MGLRINFLVNQVFDGWEPTDTRLGGTEESVVRWAEELSRRGHTVLVFHNGNKQPRYRGTDVVWVNRQSFFSDPGNADVYISIKSNVLEPGIRMKGNKPMLYLTNETNASDLDLSAYKGVIWPSQWCVDNIPVNNPKTFILPHGYDSDKIYPSEKMSKQCFYASSPDRGLETLLRVWPDVHKAHPDATLILTYGAELEPMDGVINLGEVDEDTMNEIYRTSEVWCHPANGGELFCITGIKAQASGCVPVIIPTMALKETVRHGVFADNADEYAEALITTLNSSDLRNAIREELDKEHYDNWSDSTDKLLKIIEKVI